MARIVDFLEALVDDAALEANFEQAPIRTMTAFGLTSEQGLVIIGGTSPSFGTPSRPRSAMCR